MNHEDNILDALDLVTACHAPVGVVAGTYAVQLQSGAKSHHFSVFRRVADRRDLW
jgi:hypothetical protein